MTLGEVGNYLRVARVLEPGGTSMSSSKVAVAAFIFAAVIAQPLPPNAAAQVVAAGRTFTCTPTAVWDGDGPIWCAEGPKIRIAGVAAREIDESCSLGQPCPTVSGEAARDRLVALFGGARGTLPTGHVKVRAPAMTCQSDGSAGGSRTAAWCRSPAFGDLSCAVIARGGAIRWARYWRNHRC